MGDFLGSFLIHLFTHKRSYVARFDMCVAKGGGEEDESGVGGKIIS